MELVLVLGVVLLVVVAGFGVTIYFLNRRLAAMQDNTALGLIKQDLQGMTQVMAQSQAHMNERLDKAAAVFGSLQNQLGQMQELGRSMRDIQDVLKSPKLRGNIGEQLMTDLIKQQIPKANYGLQHAFRSGNKVDAVIRTKNGLIPIDSKFPAENFLKFTQAKDEQVKATAHKEFVSDVKKHIQAISKKYIVPSEGTVDFALMYVPGEAIYYEIMMNTELCDIGASSRVYLVSPQSFYYFLQTVLLGLEGQLIEEKAKEVMNYLKSIQADSKRFGSELLLVNKHMTNAKNAVDSATSTYASLGNKIDSASQLTIDTGQAAAQITADIEEKQESLV
ncbi:MAG TPA: DNA recombination protein RmuC [Candidatus Saccharimonadales bacterium]|nr:DNA recombination protein RmuC [Candidatus Saccharimonadales bacterium]